MNDYKPVTVETAKAIAEGFQKSQVIIIAVDPAHSCTHYTTYGVSPSDKVEAAALGDEINHALTGGAKVRTFEDFRDDMPAAEARAEVERLTKEQYVPGQWRCPKCGFTQMNNILCPNGVFADQKPELRPCPNDGMDMVPVTWKEVAIEADAFAMRLFEEKSNLVELCAKQAAVLTGIMVFALGCDKGGPPIVKGKKAYYPPVMVPLGKLMERVNHAPVFRELPEDVQCRGKEIRKELYGIE